MFEKKEEKPMLSSALLNRTSFGFSAENPMGNEMEEAGARTVKS